MSFSTGACKTFAALVLFAAAGQVLSAQWLRVNIPGTPRTPDGKPNLKAPTPKTADGKPDLSGVWSILRPKNLPGGTGYTTTLEYWMAPGEKIPSKPAAEAAFQKNFAALGAGRPTQHCMPHNVSDAYVYGLIKFVQAPAEVMILQEEFNHFREIHTDGRELPRIVTPSWLGYSVGKCAGDELVAETTGFNDQSWLDDGGHIHSEALKITERFRRTAFGHLQIQMTIDDPGAYTKPFSYTYQMELQPESELIENICDNEKDEAHISGK